MNATGAPLLSAQIDHFVEAYEAARAEGDRRCVSTFLPASSDPSYEAVAAELIRVDMEWSWQQDQRRTLADYEQLLPQPLTDPLLRRQAAFEEYRLRAQAGERVAPDEFGRRYGVDSHGWPASEALSEEASRGPGDVLQSATVACRFPEIGAHFAGFELDEELGRGAFARVYLARQGDLSHRPVALKVVAGSSLEPQHLARLQHANIVPIYSVHRDDGLTAVCMPYLGRRTLEDLLAAVRRGAAAAMSPQMQRHGQNMISTFVCRRDDTTAGKKAPAGIGDIAEGDAPSTTSPGPTDTGPSQASSTPVVPALVETLHRANYVDAAVWIAGQIAAGLVHAHARGIVHRDVKPANVLLSDDGTPMLLDFNLSAEAVVHGRESLNIGGTLPYMSPEQLAAVADGGRVGPQTDLYAVGVVTYELLTGSRPFPDRRGPLQDVVRHMLADRRKTPPAARVKNPLVPRSVDAMVRRCLAADPAQRYATAAELQEDLARHLRHEPLRFAPDRSPRERLQKWARRHPRAMSAGGVAVAASACLAIAAMLWWGRGVQLARLEAERTLERFSQVQPSLLMALGTHEIAAQDPHLLPTEIAQAREQLQVYGVLNDPAWTQRDAYRRLPPSQQSALRRRLGETIYLLVRAALPAQRRAATAIERGETPSVAETLTWNQRALDLFEPGKTPGALLAQRAELLEIARRPEEAALLRLRARRQPLDDRIDDRIDAYAEIYALLDARKFRDTLPLLSALRDRHPTDPVVWLLLGDALAAGGQNERAESHYAMATALQPTSYMALFQRGLSHLALRDYPQALADFDAAIRLRPDVPSGYLNRAIALRAMKQRDRATADLTHALELGATQTRAYFLRAQLRSEMGDADGARDDLAQGLRREPIDELSWVARGVARLRDEPEGALADFQQALQLNPLSVDALRNVVHVLGDRLGRSAEALAALNTLLAIDPRDAAALGGRAVIRARAGQGEAAQADVQALLQISTAPQSLFQAACVLALTSNEKQDNLSWAATLLSRAVLADPRWLVRSKNDPDLANLRSSPLYQQLAALAEPSNRQPSTD